MDLVSFYLRGGLLMYPILLLSLIGVYIILERWLTLRKSRPPAGSFQLRLRKFLESKNVQLAREFCIQEKSPAGRIVSAGLEKIHHGAVRVRQAMEDQGREEVNLLERHLSVLASIAGIAPMLGFLGTVTGMVSAFQAVAATGGQASPATLADGIWEALITTVFGLAVGIIAYGFYNYLVNATQTVVSALERVGRDALDAIEESIYHGSSTPDTVETKLRLRREEAST
jgi:biopolymer transport protein ExbB